MRTRLAAGFLCAYASFLLYITLAIYPTGHPAPNPVPFRSIIHDWSTGGKGFVVNFLGNIAAFVPMGILIPRAFPRLRSVRGVLAACALFSGLIECLQYLSGRRVCDVDDVLLNGLGGLLGFLIARRGIPIGETKVPPGL